MTDQQKLLMALTGYDDDTDIMNCIWEIDLKMEELRKGYYLKYFRKDLKRAWGFTCHHCGERMKSDKDESYYVVTVTWQDPDKPGKRFCSKECADVFFNESMEWLLSEQRRYEEERIQLNKINK